MTLTVGELCAGAGMLGLSLASLLNVEPAWYAETDEAAAKVWAAHWPGPPNVGDLTAADWSVVEPVDILCGGIPCQSWSLAGKRKGSEDERDLWPVRKTTEDGRPRRGALDAIRELRPRLFVLENVPGLLTAEAGVPFGTILADLDELGYAVSWTVVGACRVGACHHRHRLFLAAVPAELVADTDRPQFPPSSWRTPTGWQSTAGTLFGDSGPVSWPQAGLVVDGHAWPLPADPCGASGIVLPTPTPTATAYGSNQSPSAGAAVRPSLDGVVRMLPTPVAADGGAGRGSSAGNGLRNTVRAMAGELESWEETPDSWVPLPTPTARIAEGRGTPNAETASRRMFEEGRRNLEDAVALLPTPRTSDVHGAGHHGDGGLDLRTAVSMLPTPRARDVKGAETEDARRKRVARGTAHEGFDLPTAVSMLPTPTARDATRGAGWGDQSGRPLSEVIALLPTPVASDAARQSDRYERGNPTLIGALLPTPVADSRGTRNATAGRSPGSTANDGWTLCDVVYAGRLSASDACGVGSSEPTPRASDAEKGGPNQRGSSGDLMLPAAVQPGRFGVYEAAVRRQESAFGLPAPEPTEPGRLGKPRLAAPFPEWLMGLPTGWITDHVGRNEAIKIAGNGLVWQACAYALPLLPTFRAFVAAVGESIRSEVASC